MAEPAVRRDPSPLEAALERVGDRWSLLIVEALLDGPRRFNEIGEAVAGIAPAASGGGKKPPKRERKAGGGPSASSESLPAPLQGTIFKVAVEKGAEVSEGDLICVIEAMKMENEITAHRSGKVEELNVSEGDAVSSGDVLAVIR